MIAKSEELDQTNAEVEQGRGERRKDRWQAEERRRRPVGRQRVRKDQEVSAAGADRRQGEGGRGGREGRERTERREKEEGGVTEAFDHPVHSVRFSRLVSLSLAAYHIRQVLEAEEMREEEPRLGREGRWMRHAADSGPGRENVGGKGTAGGVLSSLFS